MGGALRTTVPDRPEGEPSRYEPSIVVYIEVGGSSYAHDLGLSYEEVTGTWEAR